MITKKLSVEKKESNLESSQRIQVSQEEIAKRRNIQRLVLGSIAVDNSPINPVSYAEEIVEINLVN